MAQEEREGLQHLLGGVGRIGLLGQQLHARVVRVALEEPAGEQLERVEAEHAADHVEEEAGAREGPALGPSRVQVDIPQVPAHRGEAGVRGGDLALVPAQLIPGAMGEQGEPAGEVPQQVGLLGVALYQVPVDKLVFSK